MGTGGGQAAEQIQREVGRKLLGMNSKTADEAIRGDMGWWTMKGRRDFARLKFWHKIVVSSNDRLLKQVYNVCKGALVLEKSSWLYATRKLLTELNLAHVWLTENTGSRTEWLALIKECIRGKEIAIWKAGLEKKPKLRLYRSLKENLKREEYLRLPNEQRSLIATMRSGTNGLRVETGRWLGEALENRICMLCGTGAVEDEQHFMVSCEIYTELRSEMFQRIQLETDLNFEEMKDDPRWVLNATLGCGLGDKQARMVAYRLVAQFIRLAQKKRGQLLERFKRMNRRSRDDELDSAFFLLDEKEALRPYENSQ